MRQHPDSRTTHLFLTAAFGWCVAISSLVAIRYRAPPTLLIPVALAALPLWGEKRRSAPALTWLSLLLLFACSLVAGFTVGFFYLPGCLFLVLALWGMSPLKRDRGSE